MQTFVSTKNRYPDGDHNWRWAFGDLSSEFVVESKKTTSMRDILSTQSPYKICYPGESPEFGKAFLVYNG